MPCKISEIIDIIRARPINLRGAEDLFSAVSANSKSCSPGTIFVAAQGVKADGHNFIEDAFSNGASLAVISDETKLGNYPGLLVEDTRKALSRLASYFAGDPSGKLTCIGITGTNGKTTIHWMLHALLSLLGRKTLRVGTLGTYAEGVSDRKEGLTTPDPISLHQDFAAALNSGVQTVVMEVSSHALHQDRVTNVAFDVGVFTNLTRDHLDYHGDMESYFRAKEKLFALMAEGKKNTKIGVINIDCPFGRRLMQWKALNLISYGRSDNALIRVHDIKATSSSSTFLMNYKGREERVESHFIGRHNTLNIAAAVGVCVGLGFSYKDVLRALPQVPQVPGRLQHVQGPGFDVFIDYAHTPDALENALSALRVLSKGKLWVLFGCGGDRDKGKRPQMAEIASQIADNVVVTSDNPRTEDPQSIIDDILRTGIKAIIVDPDRRKAIRETVSRMQLEDVLLLAGKGHEDYQIIGATKYHLSDLEEVTNAIRDLGAKG